MNYKKRIQIRDFKRNIDNEVLIIEVDLYRASLADADKFRIILDKEMENGFKRRVKACCNNKDDSECSSLIEDSGHI
jgi:hypothetical protein